MRDDLKTKEYFIKTVSIACLAVLLVFSAFILIEGWAGGHFENFDALRAYIQSFGIWGPVVLTLIQFFQVILPVLPGFLGCIVGGALFGTMAGFWINYIGISAGSIAAYWLAKKYGIKLVNKMVSCEKYESYFAKYTNSKKYSVVLFLSILLPLAPDDFLCYFSGLINMPAKRFIIITLTAKPWCIFIYSYFFAHFI